MSTLRLGWSGVVAIVVTVWVGANVVNVDDKYNVVLLTLRKKFEVTTAG